MNSIQVRVSRILSPPIIDGRSFDFFQLISKVIEITTIIIVSIILTLHSRKITGSIAALKGRNLVQFFIQYLEDRHQSNQRIQISEDVRTAMR